MSYYAIIQQHGPQAKESLDWCNLDCVTPTGIVKNTMCMYAQQKATFQCHSIRDTTASETIKEILHQHNEYRNLLAGGKKGWPSAANMRQIAWDAALEALALRWAQQCVEDYDQCRRTPDFYTVGQNYCVLANWKYYVDGAKDCFKGWTHGILAATPKIINSFEGGEWAHFTQIVWANTYKMGCAQVHFRQTGRGVRWFKTALVCNYGPGGNLITNRIYKTGDPCSQCPNNTSCRTASSYPNLCALNEDPIGPQDIIDDNIYSKKNIKNCAGMTSAFTFGDACKLGQLKCEKKGVIIKSSIQSLIPIMMTVMHITVGYPI